MNDGPDGKNLRCELFEKLLEGPSILTDSVVSGNPPKYQGEELFPECVDELRMMEIIDGLIPTTEEADHIPTCKRCRAVMLYLSMDVSDDQ
jgi:hypothetical protein